MEAILLIALEVIIVLAILGVIFAPHAEPAVPSAGRAYGKPRRKYKGVPGLLRLRTDRRELAKQFKQWSVNAAFPKRVALSDTLPVSAENFAAWVSGLSDQELERFADKVARYCSSVNFDVGWQNDAQLGYAPELKQLVEDSVLMYALGAWHPDGVQSDVPVFLAYRAWRANPDRRKEFGLQLHQVLIECGQVTPPPELFLSSKKEREAQAITAICKVADENPAGFRLALRQLAGLAASPPRATLPITPSRGKLEHDLDEIRTRARKLESDLDITTQAKAGLEKELDTTQVTLRETEGRAHQLEGDLGATKQSLSGAIARGDQLQATLDTTLHAKAELEKRLGALELALREAEARVRQLKADLDATTQAKAALEKKLAAVQLALRETEARARQLEDDNETTLKKQIAFELELTARQDALQKELAQVQVHANQLTNELSNTTRAKIELEAELDALKLALSQLEARACQLRIGR
jgi:predicted  nucleic acid-binding Zn-ribbon protein